jgi:hypothetical protein
MGDNVDKTNPDNALVVKTEKKVGEYIRNMISNYIKRKKIIKNKEKNLLTTFNPLTSHLYFKMSYLYFKTFITYYKENAEIIKQQEDAFSLNSSSEENEEEEEEHNIVDIRSMGSSARVSEHQRLKETDRDNTRKLMTFSINSSNRFLKSNIGNNSGFH